MKTATKLKVLRWVIKMLKLSETQKPWLETKLQMRVIRVSYISMPDTPAKWEEEYVKQMMFNELLLNNLIEFEEEGPPSSNVKYCNGGVKKFATLRALKR